MPAEGFYSATKHALEAYADVWRMEVAPFGVRVALVEPGFVRTNFASKAQAVGAPWPSTRKCGVRSDKVSPTTSRRDANK